jgi:hypothetical protein
MRPKANSAPNHRKPGCAVQHSEKRTVHRERRGPGARSGFHCQRKLQCSERSLNDARNASRESESAGRTSCWNPFLEFPDKLRFEISNNSEANTFTQHPQLKISNFFAITSSNPLPFKGTRWAIAIILRPPNCNEAQEPLSAHNPAGKTQPEITFKK